jgi:hypothetical protein
VKSYIYKVMFQVPRFQQQIRLRSHLPCAALTILMVCVMTSHLLAQGDTGASQEQRPTQRELWSRARRHCNEYG